MQKLVHVFDPRANALNAVRLGLSVGVIVFHSFPLTGTGIGFRPFDQLLGSFFVDAFFAISGYLILSSWIRRPHWWAYLRARILRIMPGFYVSCLITTLVIGPVAIVIGGLGFPTGYGRGAVTYLLHNGLLRVHQYDVAGTPLAVPYPHVWNGSIWTLWWEFLCYLGVLALGLARVLRWRATIVSLFGVTLVAFIATAYGPVHQYYIDNGARFGLMFLAGSMVYTFRDRLPVSWSLVGLAGAIVVASAWLPDYRLAAALPIAYVVIVSGALIKNARLRLPNDISYGDLHLRVLDAAAARKRGAGQSRCAGLRDRLHRGDVAACGCVLVRRRAPRAEAQRRPPYEAADRPLAARSAKGW